MAKSCKRGKHARARSKAERKAGNADKLVANWGSDVMP